MPERGFGLAVGRGQSLQHTGWLPTGRHRPAVEYADLEARSLIEVRFASGTLCAAGLQDQANGGACDHALQVGAPGRGTIDFLLLLPLSQTARQLIAHFYQWPDLIRARTVNVLTA